MPIWILIADGAQAIIISYNSAEENLSLVSNGIFSHMHQPSRELTSTKRGRAFNSSDSRRSPMERTTDPHDQ